LGRLEDGVANDGNKNINKNKKKTGDSAVANDGNTVVDLQEILKRQCPRTLALSSHL
jgi:hypothetical protein